MKKTRSARGNAAGTSASSSSLKSKPDLGNEERSSRIALSAYYRAEARGFAPGYELEDWLAAEAEEKSW